VGLLSKMVREVEKNGKTYFMCEACDMYYGTRELAQKCEDFCNEYKSCNTELMKHAVTFDGEKKGCC